MNDTAPLALTMGDPAGIGPDITLACWARRINRRLPPFYCIADPATLVDRAKRLGLDIPIAECTPGDAASAFAAALPVVDLNHPVSDTIGEADPTNAEAVLNSIRKAVGDVHAGLARAVVTNPVHKKSLYGAGFSFPGQTEFLGDLAAAWNAPRNCPVMMLASSKLRVIPATIHLPLRQAIEQLNTADLLDVIVTAADDLKSRFLIENPKIALSGLNPHAGEEGAMGREEIDIILPAIEAARARGVDVIGPLPADTMFHDEARKTYDVAITMYHDQALIPAKALAFDSAVNVTLGLPFVRTSPDHGTAFSLAGHGTANPDSLAAAIRLADEMTSRTG
jgi:4-hydroxythreonine-4-phosphate dehydrogenase